MVCVEVSGLARAYRLRYFESLQPEPLGPRDCFKFLSPEPQTLKHLAPQKPLIGVRCLNELVTRLYKRPQHPIVVIKSPRFKTSKDALDLLRFAANAGWHLCQYQAIGH